MHTQPNQNQKKHHYGQQIGASLIEVLVSVFIISIGLLGLAALQNSSLKLSYDSYQRSQATFLTYDFIDRVRANPSAAAYTLNATDNPVQQNCFASTSCTPAQLRAFDLYYWKQQVDALLPEAVVSVTFNNATSLYTMNMSWQDKFQNDQLNANDQKQFSYTFRIN